MQRARFVFGLHFNQNPSIRLIMLRHLTSSFCKRYYSDSNFRTRAPVVRVANSRVGRTLKRRSDAETQYKDVKEHDPTLKFEPFPFKVTEENKVEVLRRTVLPLSDIPYEEELAGKQAFCRNSLRHLAQELYKNGTPVRLDVNKLPCHVNPIVRAEQIDKYRNLDEFSIWNGLDGKTPTVGYMIFPIRKHGDTVCVEPNGCGAQKEEVDKLADILQDFIRHQAKLPICFSLGGDGGWRRFSVRSNNQRELMLTGFISPRMLKVQQILDEKENFRDFVIKRSEESNLNLRSLYFQPCPNNRCSPQQVPYELLYGEENIFEIINNLKIMISPTSYFPQSTTGAEALIKAIRDTAIDSFGLSPDSTNKPLILDVPCNVGLVGMNLHNLASKIVGVDRNSLSTDEASENALNNNLVEFEFIISELEIVIERVLEKYSRFKNDTLAVCIAPNLGLHRNVVRALRGCGDVRRIIYVSPKPESEGFINNLTDLCKKEAGKVPPPFVPVSATPVDVYPRTKPCSFILALERLDS